MFLKNLAINRYYKMKDKADYKYMNEKADLIEKYYPRWVFDYYKVEIDEEDRRKLSNYIVKYVFCIDCDFPIMMPRIGENKCLIPVPSIARCQNYLIGE